jgi:hypothetical protein
MRAEIRDDADENLFNFIGQWGHSHAEASIFFE